MKIHTSVSVFLLLSVVSSGYAPEKVECPQGRLTREANGLCQEETEWVTDRQKITQANLKRFVESAHLEDFDCERFFEQNVRPISIGLAFSGGGFRAMLSGAGQLAALDSRTEGANEKGLGGILQSATYMSGLSGGSWLLGSVVSNNFTSVQDIIDGKTEIWDLSYSILDGKDSGIMNMIKYYKSLVADVVLKMKAGFSVTLTDIWGRALSHHFFSGGNYGADLHWAKVQEMFVFTSHQMPFPIVVANARTPGNSHVDQESTIVEVTPYELGSWDPSLNAFFQTKHLGTEVNDGMPLSQSCVRGYDNSGFVLGTSSTLFNEVFGKAFTSNVTASGENGLNRDRDRPGPQPRDIPRGRTMGSSRSISTINDTSTDDTSTDIQNTMNTINILNIDSDVDHTVAAYKPNPFKNAREAGLKSLVNEDMLGLVDGGEDLQNVPLYPLVQQARNVDVIFAYDNSADTFDDWPNGASMKLTYTRSKISQGKGMMVPEMPDSNTFISHGFDKKPVFFGCSATVSANGGNPDPNGNGNPNPNSNTTHSLVDKSVPPLIIYTANRKHSYDSNKSTFRFVYDDPMKLAMIRNGFETATRNNASDDTNWKVCVSCALIRREEERRGAIQSVQCKKCFSEYCWSP